MTHQFNLTKPLVLFDLETTGTDVKKDRIVSIALVKYYPGGKTEAYNNLVNPEIPIPPKATEIHGITDEMVKGFSPFREIASKVYQYFKDADIGGFYVIGFDLPILAREFDHYGEVLNLDNRTVMDVAELYRKLNRRTLANAYKQYVGKELDGGHNALVDTLATAEVLFNIQVKHEMKHQSLPEISSFALGGKKIVDPYNVVYRNPQGRLCFATGFYKDQLVKKNEKQANYILDHNYPKSVKDLILDELNLPF